MAKTMDEPTVRALPVTVDLPTAGRCFGLGRTKAYEMARAGEFPCPVLPIGRRFVVTKAALLRALGYEVPETRADATENPAA
jgi:hypothetical protein